ncbi:MAG: phage tail protein, partial [Clostridia bacterium]|nr:phage tail protein [Clostridia bacterium]
MPICIYPPLTNDFSTNGLGILTPLECTVEEVAAGKYELELVHPIDNTLRWAQIQSGCIIKASCPVRENPLYEEPALTEPVTVTRQVWKVSASSGAYLYTGPGSGKKLSKKKKNTEVIELADAADPWKKVCVVKGGQVGYMSTKSMKTSRTVKETIDPTKPTGESAVQVDQSRDQLFRIYSVEQDSASGTVTAKAMHVFYDEAGNLIDAKYEPKKAILSAVLDKIKSSLHRTAAVDFLPIHLDGRITADLSYKTPIEAFLDPDEGIVAQTNAILFRDNWDACLLRDMIRDRGVTVRRGKNLIGVEVTNDISDVVTRIIPVGKNKKGDDITLSGTKYVDSVHINEYPFPRVKRIEYDVQTGQDGFNSDTAVRNEIKRLAQADFNVNGVDLPTYGMEIDFVLLGNTAEYADYASLQAVHLYDTVTVIDEMLGLTAKVRVTGYTWNCLTEQYDSVTLGDLQDVHQTVYSYNLPTGGVSGIKIMNNSLGGVALRDATIEYAKITNAAIEQLSANAITALTARIQEIVAQKLTTDELYAAYAEMIALKVGTITADNIATDTLAAELARITVLSAGTADFDKATIQHLVAQAMNLEFGVAGQVFVKNLAVEYAQMVGAAIGELCIKASDGNYYLMDVNPDGTVTATKTTVSVDEANAGQTSGGNVILETNITAANLNAGNLLATYALVNQIDAARIDVDQLFAREAFINLLRTKEIFGNESITIIAERANKSFRQEDMPTEGIKLGD